MKKGVLQGIIKDFDTQILRAAWPDGVKRAILEETLRAIADGRITGPSDIARALGMSRTHISWNSSMMRAKAEKHGHGWRPPTARSPGAM